MPLSAADRAYLRDLATKIAEIAADPYNAKRRREWYLHNDLKPARPMVLIFPEGSWSEILPDSDMRIGDPVWRQREWWLRHVIYRWHHLRDDNVIEPVVDASPQRGVVGWALSGGMTARPSGGRGAARYAPDIIDPVEGLKKFTSSRPHLVVNHEAKQRTLEEMTDVFGGILEIRWKRSPGINTSLTNHLCYLRGLDQVMIDMVERPEWLHELLSFMADCTETLLDELEASGELEIMEKSPDYPGSGGTCYTHDLPAPDFAGKVRFKDTWGFAESQEYTGVSPRMLEEFALRYQVPLVARFGLNCYGCCEDLTTKLDLVIRAMPNLRRISIAPWTDVRVAAEKLQGRYIYSWKPNPACVSNPFDTDHIRAGIRRTFGIAREHGCHIEAILKDTHTCNNHPERMTEWVKIAKEEAERAADLVAA